MTEIGLLVLAGWHVTDRLGVGMGPHAFQIKLDNVLEAIAVVLLVSGTWTATLERRTKHNKLHIS